MREGKLWRAKEILQGVIRSGGYDPIEFERLGQVLLQMGDDVEAGKYLFLSGVRNADYAEAIQLYVERYTAKESVRIYDTFPRAARLSRLDEYPQAVAAELASLGIPQQLPNSARHLRQPPPSWAGTLALWGCLLVVVAVIGLAIVGAASILSWL